MPSTCQTGSPSCSDDRGQKAPGRRHRPEFLDGARRMIGPPIAGVLIALWGRSEPVHQRDQLHRGAHLSLPDERHSEKREQTGRQHVSIPEGRILLRLRLPADPVHHFAACLHQPRRRCPLWCCCRFSPRTYSHGDSHTLGIVARRAWVRLPALFFWPRAGALQDWKRSSSSLRRRWVWGFLPLLKASSALCTYWLSSCLFAPPRATAATARPPSERAGCCSA